MAAKNLALLGCGAIAQTFYIPAISKLRSAFDRIWFVDPSNHALIQATSMVVGETAHKLSDIADELNFVVVAVPNALHYELAEEALSRGAHVLIEKPFVVWPEEGRKLIEQAARSQRILAVNQTRRFSPVAIDIRRRVAAGSFGALKSVTHREGVKLDWPFESGAAFAKDALRTGAIMDFGVHIIDFYQYILQPEWKVCGCVHDGFNGPEGLADIHLEANQAQVSLKLSRYYFQQNMATLSFQKAQIVIDVFDWNSYMITDESGTRRVKPGRGHTRTYYSFAEDLLLNFVGAGEGAEAAICDGCSALPVIEVLDQIYRVAKHYPSTVGAV